MEGEGDLGVKRLVEVEGGLDVEKLLRSGVGGWTLRLGWIFRSNEVW